MAQINQDLVIYAGNDIDIRFEGIFDEGNNEIIAQGDILGATFAVSPYQEFMTIPLIEKSLSASGITVPADGIIVVRIEASDTEDLYGEFSMELRLLDVSGSVITASRGRISIKYSIASNPV